MPTALKTAAVVLACAAGALAKKAAKIDAMTEPMWCGDGVRDIDGATFDYYRYGDSLYVETEADFFTNLTVDWSMETELEPDCTKDLFVKTGFIGYNPMGHGGLDFFGGGYGVPHWDIHFFKTSSTDRAAGGDYDVTSCVTTLIPIQCDLTSDDPRNLKFHNIPPSEEITGFKEDQTFGGHAIIGHANHLLPTRAFEKGGAQYITLDNNGITSPTDVPPWLACAMQAPGGQGDQGCRMDVWDGLDPILLTFNGEVIGEENMFTDAAVTAVSSAVPDDSDVTSRLGKPFPTAEKYVDKSKHASEIFIEAFNDASGVTKVVRIGNVNGNGGKKKGKGKNAKLSTSTAPSFNSAVHTVGLSAGVGLIVIATALVGIRARRNAKVVIIEEDAETTPLTA